MLEKKKVLILYTGTLHARRWRKVYQNTLRKTNMKFTAQEQDRALCALRQ